jgi:hypothetical protein
MSAPSLSTLPSSKRPERPARRSIQTMLPHDAYDLVFTLLNHEGGAEAAGRAAAASALAGHPQVTDALALPEERFSRCRHRRNTVRSSRTAHLRRGELAAPRRRPAARKLDRVRCTSHGVPERAYLGPIKVTESRPGPLGPLREERMNSTEVWRSTRTTA